MNQSTRVSIQTADFDLSSEVAQLRAQNAGVGAAGQPIRCAAALEVYQGHARGLAKAT